VKDGLLLGQSPGGDIVLTWNLCLRPTLLIFKSVFTKAFRYCLTLQGFSEEAGLESG
jgi:hypothetical protein